MRKEPREGSSGLRTLVISLRNECWAGTKDSLDRAWVETFLSKPLLENSRIRNFTKSVSTRHYIYSNVNNQWINNTRIALPFSSLLPSDFLFLWVWGLQACPACSPYHSLRSLNNVVVMRAFQVSQNWSSTEIYHRGFIMILIFKHTIKTSHSSLISLPIPYIFFSPSHWCY